jgi:hypothetical protein
MVDACGFGGFAVFLPEQTGIDLRRHAQHFPHRQGPEYVGFQIQHIHCVL